MTINLYLSPRTKRMENLIIRPASLKRRKTCHSMLGVIGLLAKALKSCVKWSRGTTWALPLSHYIVAPLAGKVIDSWWLGGHMGSLKTKSGLCTLKSPWEELSSTFTVNPVCPLSLWKHSCNCIDAFRPRKDPARGSQSQVRLRILLLRAHCDCLSLLLPQWTIPVVKICYHHYK